MESAWESYTIQISTRWNVSQFRQRRHGASLLQKIPSDPQRQDEVRTVAVHPG